MNRAVRGGHRDAVMKRVASRTGMATVLFLGTLALGACLWASSALSDPLMAMAVPAERAADVVRTMRGASASHTATAHHAHARHRHRHHAPHALIAANPAPVPGPDAPLP